MIVVTGAGGHLGRLVIDGLLDTAEAGRIVAAVRNPDAAADLAARGVVVRHADYDEPATLAAAFAGVQKLLLISSNAVGTRVAQHKAAIEAAAGAGAEFVAYTSVLHVHTSPLIIAPDHAATEAVIAGSGLPHAFLRNGWYTENYAPAVRGAVESGVIVGSAGDGRVASATRADYAAAAVAVLTGGGQGGSGEGGTVYELSGDTAWSYAELAAEVSRIAGRDVVYRDVTPEEHRAALLGAGLPEVVADMYVSFDRDIRAGALAATPGDLRELIGRPTTTLSEAFGAP